MALKVNDREAEQARQMFLFSCFTGLAIADMDRLKFSHIQTSADGRRYIRKERLKTKVESVVPLHPIAEEILNKSQEEQAVKKEGDALVFPHDCSRSVMNNKLSTVGKACGVRQRISFHMAAPHVRNPVAQRRHPDREHRQDDGACVHIQHADLCASDGQKDLRRHGQADPEATSGFRVIPVRLS